MKTGRGSTRPADPVRMKLAACLALVLAAAGCGGPAPAGLEVTASQRVHPVLIRNDHNPLMRADGRSPGSRTQRPILHIQVERHRRSQRH